MSFAPGTNQLIAGRYRLLQPLGSGGFGDTFLATDEQLPSGRQVVVKRLRPIKDDEPSREAVNNAFRREARLLERVGRDHSQIPELFAYFEEDGAFWLVQEFVPGPTLTSLGRISADTARQILRDLLPVLAHLHSRNLLHRDIKPDNIILRDGDQKPVLIDFGAVRETMSTVVLSSGTAGSSLVIGTQGFMPPEQAAGRPIFSSDLYALSLSLIALITGKSPQELPADPVSGAILWRSEVPGIDPGLAELLDRAIQPIPAQRFPTAQAMLEALGPDATPASVPPAATSAPTPSPTQATVVVAPQQPVSAGTPQPPSQAPSAPPGYVPATATSGNNSLVAIALSGFGLIIAVALGLGAIFISQQNQQQAQLAEARREAQQAKDRQQQLEKEKADAEAQRKAAEAQQQAESQKGAEVGLTRTQAVDLVNRWLGSKGQIFAPPYDASAAASVVTGTLWQDLVKDDGPVSWLRNNNSYYTYTASRVDEVLGYDVSGGRPSLRVKIHEERTLHTPTGIDAAQSGVTDAIFTYYFEQENGTWMVADYTKG